MKHSYDTQCSCARCTRERTRRQQQSDAAPRPTTPPAHVRTSRRAQRAEREHWDAFESGRPMSSDDY